MQQSLSLSHSLTHTHTDTQTHTQTHTHTLTQTHTDAYTHMHTHIHTHTHTHTHIHTHKRVPHAAYLRLSFSTMYSCSISYSPLSESQTHVDIIIIVYLAIFDTNSMFPITQTKIRALHTIVCYRKKKTRKLWHLN